MIVDADAGVFANDTDGAPLTAVLVADAADGVVSLSADGSFIYVAEPAFDGADSFTYQANNGAELSAVTDVTLTDALSLWTWCQGRRKR